MLAQRLALPVAWLLVAVAFGALEPDTFLTTANLRTILGSQAVLAVVTLACCSLSPRVTTTFRSRRWSRSAAMLVAVLNVQEGCPPGGRRWWRSPPGRSRRAANGALVALLEVDSFITTLGSGAFISGVVLWMSDSNTIGGISQSLIDPVVGWELLGLPLAFYYALALCTIVWYALEFTPGGCRLLFVGRGRSVARLSGVRVARARLGAFVACGTISALAGVLYAGTNGAADPSSGASFLLPAFAAAFLGATSIAPGRFNAWGAIVAVYFLVTAVTGLQLLGVESFVQQLFYGGALVLAVVLMELGRRITRGEIAGG